MWRPVTEEEQDWLAVDAVWETGRGLCHWREEGGFSFVPGAVLAERLDPYIGGNPVELARRRGVLLGEMEIDPGWHYEVAYEAEGKVYLLRNLPTPNVLQQRVIAVASEGVFDDGNHSDSGWGDSEP